MSSILKLYFSKGSSALAAHILLEDVGAAYEAVEVSIADQSHCSPAYLRINPRGRIPALQTPEGVIAENPAILEYIAATHPDANVLPTGVFAQSQARSLSAYLCATVHVAFAHHKRAERWASEARAIEDMRAKAPGNLLACARFLENELALSPWAFPAGYCYCDPYLFLLGGWLDGVGETLENLPKLKRHNDAMRARPATDKALAVHGLAKRYGVSGKS